MYMKISTRENTGVDYEDKARRKDKGMNYDEME